MLVRAPHPRLAHVVRRLWTAEGGAAPEAPAERVLPTGEMHLVFRLGGPPLRLWRPGAGFEPVARAVVGGVRKTAYIRALDPAGPSVGAQLRPGAAAALFGLTAAALADAHTPAADLWGAFAEEAHQRLCEAPDPEARLRVFEALLLSRLEPERRLHPAVAHGVAALRRGASVAEVVAASGFSHRHFGQLFQAQVGAPPKVWARVQRMQSALRFAHDAGQTLVDVAAHAGYADQAHLTRELRALTGLSPGAYRRAAPRSPHHVPVFEL